MNSFHEWVRKDLVERTSALADRFSHNQPFPHIVIKDFLHEEKARALLAALKKERFSHKESDLFSLNQTVDFSDSSQPVLKQFFSVTASEAFSTFMKELTGLKVKPGALDLAGSLYKSGDYLLCHDDQVQDRKIAYILYLSEGFEERDGARFVLFNNKSGKPAHEAKAYVPEWNSLMVFAVSDISFHAVEENCSTKDRYAIGGWLH